MDRLETGRENLSNASVFQPATRINLVPVHRSLVLGHQNRKAWNMKQNGCKTVFVLYSVLCILRDHSCQSPMPKTLLLRWEVDGNYSATKPQNGKIYKSSFPSGGFPWPKSITLLAPSPSLHDPLLFLRPYRLFMMRLYLLFLSTAISVTAAAKASQNTKPPVPINLPDPSDDVSTAACGAEGSLDSSVNLDKTGLLTRSTPLISRNWLTDRWNQVWEWLVEDELDVHDPVFDIQGQGSPQRPGVCQQPKIEWNGECPENPYDWALCCTGTFNLLNRGGKYYTKHVYNCKPFDQKSCYSGWCCAHITTNDFEGFDCQFIHANGL